MALAGRFSYVRFAWLHKALREEPAKVSEVVAAASSPVHGVVAGRMARDPAPAGDPAPHPQAIGRQGGQWSVPRRRARCQSPALPHYAPGRVVATRRGKPDGSRHAFRPRWLRRGRALSVALPTAPLPVLPLSLYNRTRLLIPALRRRRRESRRTPTSSDFPVAGRPASYSFLVRVGVNV